MPQSLFDNLRAQRTVPPPPRRIKPNGFARVARGCWNNAPWVIAFWLILACGSLYFSQRIYQTPSGGQLPIPVLVQSAQELSQKFPGLENLQTIVLANTDAATLEEQRSDLVSTLQLQTDAYDLVFAPGFGDYYEAHGLLYHPLDEVKLRTAYALALKPLFTAIAQAPNANSMATLVNEVSASISQGREPQGLEDLFAQSASSLQALMSGIDRPVDWSVVADLDNDSTATQAIVLAIPKPGAAAQAHAITLKLLDVIKSSSTTTVSFQQPDVSNTNPQTKFEKLDGPRAVAAGLIGLVFAGLVLALSLGRLRLVLVGVIPVLCTGAFSGAMVLKLTGASWPNYWPLFAAAVLATAQLSLRYIAGVASAANGRRARETNVMLAVQNNGRVLLWITAVAIMALVGLLFMKDPLLNKLVIATVSAIMLGYLCVVSLCPALFRVFPDASKWRAKEWLVPAHRALFEAGPWQFVAKALIGLGVAASLLVLFTITPGQKPKVLDGPVNILVNSKAKAEEMIQSLKNVKEAQSIRWLAMFLPEDGTAKQTTLAQLKDQFPRIDPVASQDPQDLRDQIETLSESLKEISSTPETKPALKKAADDFRRSLALLGATSGDEQVRQLENRLFGGFNRLADRADVLASVTAPTLETLPQELRRLFLSDDGQFRLEVLPVAGVSNANLALRLQAAGFDPVHPVVTEKQFHDLRLQLVFWVFGFAIAASAVLLMVRFGPTANLNGTGMAFAAALCFLAAAERVWQSEWNLSWLLIGILVLANLSTMLIKTPMAVSSTALSAIEVFLIPALLISLALPFALLNVSLIETELMPIALALGLVAMVVGLLQKHGSDADLLKQDDYGIDG